MATFPPPKAHRPHELDDKKREKLLYVYSKNGTNLTAAKYAGISEKTLYVWLNRGYEDLENKIDTEFSQLVQEIWNIEATKEMELITAIEEAQGWQPKSWLLERRFRQSWTSDAAELEFRKRLDELKEKKGE